VAARVESLVGLGPGATPTGDDLLCGIAAALWRLGPGPGGTAGRTALRAVLAAVPADATTPTSRAMLAHAAEGRFLEPLAVLARALGDRAADLAAAAAALTRVGAQSGADLLAGAVAAGRAVIASGALRPVPLRRGGARAGG